MVEINSGSVWIDNDQRGGERRVIVESANEYRVWYQRLPDTRRYPSCRRTPDRFLRGFTLAQDAPASPQDGKERA